MKKIKLELTPAQFLAIIDLTDDISAMIGCGDHDKYWTKNVRLIDRMLKKNGYKRKYE